MVGGMDGLVGRVCVVGAVMGFGGNDNDSDG